MKEPGIPGVHLVHAHKHAAPQVVGSSPKQEATLEINPALVAAQTHKAVMVSN